MNQNSTQNIRAYSTRALQEIAGLPVKATIDESMLKTGRNRGAAAKRKVTTRDILKKSRHLRREVKNLKKDIENKTINPNADGCSISLLEQEIYKRKEEICRIHLNQENMNIKRAYRNEGNTLSTFMKARPNSTKLNEQFLKSISNLKLSVEAARLKYSDVKWSDIPQSEIVKVKAATFDQDLAHYESLVPELRRIVREEISSEGLREVLERVYQGTFVDVENIDVIMGELRNKVAQENDVNWLIERATNLERGQADSPDVFYDVAPETGIISKEHWAKPINESDIVPAISSAATPRPLESIAANHSATLKRGADTQFSINLNSLDNQDINGRERVFEEFSNESCDTTYLPKNKRVKTETSTSNDSKNQELNRWF